MARLCVVGLSHRTAPVEVREQLAFSDEILGDALKQVLSAPGVNESLLLSTCNRVELYAAIDEDAGFASVQHFMVAARGLPASLASHLYAHDGDAALRHLFRVASSLDSMVVGEPQILGQVKEAFQRSLDHGAVGPLLGRVLPRAFQLAKRIRTETEIARNASSVASVAVDLAAQIFGELKEKRVLVVGAGKMGALSAKHLKAAGIEDLIVINRTEARAQELAKELGGRASPWESLDAELRQADIVLCSTGAKQPIFTREKVAAAMKQRRGRWLFFIDIAVPRDVDARVGKLENVYLYDVDALEEVLAQNRAGRQKEAAEAEAIVDGELERFRREERTQEVVPIIKALREHFLSVAQQEAERTLGKLPSLDEKQRAQIAQMAEAIVNKLLHQPLTALKQDDSAALAAAVERLFGR